MTAPGAKREAVLSLRDAGEIDAVLLRMQGRLDIEELRLMSSPVRD